MGLPATTKTWHRAWRMAEGRRKASQAVRVPNITRMLPQFFDGLMHCMHVYFFPLITRSVR